MSLAAGLPDVAGGGSAGGAAAFFWAATFLSSAAAASRWDIAACRATRDAPNTTRDAANKPPTRRLDSVLALLRADQHLAG